LLAIYLDLLRYELQAMTAFEARFTFDRLASVAAMQEQVRNLRKIVAARHIRSDFRRKQARRRSIRCRPTGLAIPQRPLTGFNRFATCSMIWRLAAEPPDAREEAMQW
jgi:hypothetical protein